MTFPLNMAFEQGAAAGAPGRLLAASITSGGVSPSGGVSVAQVTAIDGTATGETAILSPSGFNAHVIAINATLTAIGGAGAVPTVGFGIAAGADDVIAPVSLLGLTAANKTFAFPILGVLPVLQSGQTLSIGIDTGATYDTYTLTIEVVYYRK